MQIIDAATIQQIKQKSGLTFQQAKDYAKLSELIEKETEEYVSENTLRRLMGATPNNSEARQSTLNAIARYLGFPIGKPSTTITMVQVFAQRAKPSSPPNCSWVSTSRSSIRSTDCCASV